MSLRTRVGAYGDRVRDALRATFEETHAPRELAASFAVGTLITMLPTLGTGLVLFVVIALVSDRVSKLALVASVVVFTPVVKWGVYAASFALGVLLGPVEGVRLGDASLDAGPEILVRLLVGNLILAVVAAVAGYVVVHRPAVAYRGTELGDAVEAAVEDVVEEVLEE